MSLKQYGYSLQFLISDMKTAKPRIPSPRTAGIMSVLFYFRRLKRSKNKNLMDKFEE